MRQPATAITGHQWDYDFGLLDPPFQFYRKLKMFQAEKYPDSREKRLHDKILRIQKFSDSKFPLSNQTEEFLFWIRPLVY